jgi:hypothetical protein
MQIGHIWAYKRSIPRSKLRPCICKLEHRLELQMDLQINVCRCCFRCRTCMGNAWETVGFTTKTGPLPQRSPTGAKLPRPVNPIEVSH